MAKIKAIGTSQPFSFYAPRGRHLLAVWGGQLTHLCEAKCVQQKRCENMTSKTVSVNDSGGATNSVPLPLVLGECECICHNGGEPYSCGAMCWHPQSDASEYVDELCSSTNNVDHYARLYAIYSFGKLKFLVFESSNGLLKRFEVV